MVMAAKKPGMRKVKMGFGYTTSQRKGDGFGSWFYVSMSHKRVCGFLVLSFLFVCFKKTDVI